MSGAKATMTPEEIAEWEVALKAGTLIGWRPEYLCRNCEADTGLAARVFCSLACRLEWQRARFEESREKAHGTVYGYHHFRCRCVPCVDAMRAYGRERYSANRDKVRERVRARYQARKQA